MFLASLLSTAVRTDAFAGVHRTLVAFHTGLLFDFVKRCQENRKRMDKDMAAWFLPAAMEPMQACASIQIDPSKGNLVREIIVTTSLLYLSSYADAFF